MINFKTRKPFLKFITKFIKKLLVMFLGSYLKRWCCFKFCGFKS